MNKLFLDSLVERLENEFDVVNVWNQENVLSWLMLDGKEMYNFPMLCFEHTDDSSFEVDITESKFFNDSMHKGSWIILGNSDMTQCIFNLQQHGNSLEIDAFEVNDEMRGNGVGGNVLSIIESVCDDYMESICVSPFDTSAINFWEHMGYMENHNGYWLKSCDCYE